MQHGTRGVRGALDAFRRTDAACVAVDGDIPDEFGDQLYAASKAVMRTRPTTPAGLAALTTWAREKVDQMKSHSILLGEDLCALLTSLDDAAPGQLRLSKRPTQ